MNLWKSGIFLCRTASTKYAPELYQKQPVSLIRNYASLSVKNQGIKCGRQTSWNYTVSPLVEKFSPRSHRGFHTTAIKSSGVPSEFDGITSAETTVTSTTDILVDVVQRGDLAKLGLAGNTPVGILQNSLEWLHVTAGLPWWLSIIAVTVGVRTLLFPLVGRQMRNSAKIANIQPEMMTLSQTISTNMKTGNRYEAQLASMELQSLLRKHDCNPLRSLMLPLVQMPIFLSFFLAIKHMADLPVESLKTGGAFWFTDLTAGDPTYVLPVMSALSFLLTVELGVDGVNNKAQAKTMRNVFRVLSVVMIPLTVNLPSGIFIYWLSSSTIGIVQMFLYRIPWIKRFFNIPSLDPEAATRLQIMQAQSSASTAGGNTAAPGGILSQVKGTWASAKELAEDRAKTQQTTAAINSSIANGRVKISPNKIIMRKVPQ